MKVFNKIIIIGLAIIIAIVLIMKYDSITEYAKGKYSP